MAPYKRLFGPPLDGDSCKSTIDKIPEPVINKSTRTNEELNDSKMSNTTTSWICNELSRLLEFSVTQEEYQDIAQ